MTATQPHSFPPKEMVPPIRRARSRFRPLLPETHLKTPHLQMIDPQRCLRPLQPSLDQDHKRERQRPHQASRCQRSQLLKKQVVRDHPHNRDPQQMLTQSSINILVNKHNHVSYLLTVITPVIIGKNKSSILMSFHLQQVKTQGRLPAGLPVLQETYRSAS